MANGFSAFAEGARLGQNRRRLGLEKKRLGLEERRLGLTEQRMEFDREGVARDQINGLLETLMDGKNNFIGTGQDFLNTASAQTLLRNIQVLGALSGQPSIAETAINQIMLAPTKMELAEREAQAEAAAAPIKAEGGVAAAGAALSAIDKLPDDQQELVRRQLGFKTREQTSEFFRLLDEAQRLADAGEGETERARLVRNRLTKLSQQSGFGVAIEFDDQGRPAGIRVGEGVTQPGLAGRLSGGQLFSEDQRIRLIDSDIGDLDRLIEQTELDPEDFGLVGSGRRFAQTLASGLSDLASLFTKATGEFIDVNDIVGALGQAVGVEDPFDPDIPRQKALESKLAIDLAKLRLERGGGDIRALGQIFQQAADDVSLTGFTSAQEVRSRLREIRREFEQEREAITSGLTGRSDQPSQPETKALPRTPEGNIEAEKLQQGTIYLLEDGSLWRWNGQNFTRVNG